MVLRPRDAGFGSNFKTRSQHIHDLVREFNKLFGGIAGSSAEASHG